MDILILLWFDWFFTLLDFTNTEVMAPSIGKQTDNFSWGLCRRQINKASTIASFIFFFGQRILVFRLFGNVFQLLDILWTSLEIWNNHWLFFFSGRRCTEVDQLAKQKQIKEYTAHPWHSCGFPVSILACNLTIFCWHCFHFQIRYSFARRSLPLVAVFPSLQ